METSDGWTLVVTRYEPVPQPFSQPLLGEPLLLVHGFSQNRHTWTSGEFVKNLLYFGLDIHIVELRGHGKSSQRLQHERSELTGRPLPPDLDYGWDLDSYLLHDLPAAVAAVKELTGRRRIFYCGHSMGGMLGYGYAGLHDDLEGLVTIGAPADLGRGFLLLRLVALTTPLTGAAHRRRRQGDQRPAPAGRPRAGSSSAGPRTSRGCRRVTSSSRSSTRS